MNIAMKKQQQNMLPGDRKKLLDNILLYGPFCIAAVMFAGCLAVEWIPIELTLEQRGQIYNQSGTFTYYLSIVLCILYGRKYELGWMRSVVYSLASFLLIFSVVSQIWRDVDYELLGASSVASFRSALFLPVLCFILSRFDKRSTLTLCDYLTPYFFFLHGITTHHCWLAGCCAGRTMTWGIWNPYTEQLAFPAQPYAIILSLGVSLWGLLYARKHGYKTNGKVYAVSLIVYGFFRYIMEFFSDDLRILGALSVYSICSLIMVLLGVLIYFWKSKQPVEINACETTEETMEEEI